MKTMKPLIPLIVFLASLRDVHSHAFLTKPTSKQGGNEKSYQLSSAKHFGMAAWWLDRAHFDNDPKKTPFTRPGEFNYKDANTCCGVKQVFHPCGCQHNDIGSCAAVGKGRGFGEIIGGDSITPEKVTMGGKLKTKFNMHVNHAGGYAYSICPKSEYDNCYTKHKPKSGATDAPATLAYLQCVWDCFESHPLSFAGNQMLQLRDKEADHVLLNPVSKPGKSGKLKTSYREVPIAEVGDGKNSWQYVKSFSNNKVQDQFTKDFGKRVSKGTAQVGPKGHSPIEWQVVDEVQIPAAGTNGLAPGKYLLSWRYDCGMANQLWTNCADVELVVDSKTAQPKTTPKIATTTNKLKSTPTPKIAKTTPKTSKPASDFSRSSCVSFYPCAKTSTGFCTGFLTEAAKQLGVRVQDIVSFDASTDGKRVGSPSTCTRGHDDTFATSPNNGLWAGVLYQACAAEIKTPCNARRYLRSRN